MSTKHDAVSEWYQKFKADVDENIALDEEDRSRRLLIVKDDLEKLMRGSLPMSRIFDTIRAHIVVRLGFQDGRINDEIVRNLEMTATEQPIGRNWLLLYCVHSFLENSEAAQKILNMVELPEDIA